VDAVYPTRKAIEHALFELMFPDMGNATAIIAMRCYITLAVRAGID